MWFKAKFDSLLTARQVEAICKQFPNVRDIVPFGGGMIVDLKVMRDFEPLWDDDEADKVSFVNFWGYDIQGAIYQKIDGRNYPFVIVAATKEDEPNIDAMQIPDTDLEFCLADVETLAPRFDAIKRGEIAPVGCGHCAYCRRMKKLSDIKHYKLINE